MTGLAFPRAFGSYTILGELGRGSMGVVYEARGEKGPIALKVMRMGLGSDPQSLERFQREAAVAASVPHDHIVGTLDAGEVEGEVYLTMPLLPGSSLSALIDSLAAAGERVPGERGNAVLDQLGFAPCGEGDAHDLRFARRVCAALVGVADAIAALHERGMVHRDVKPSNLMLDERGRLLLADFGLVRMSGQRLTKTGQILGTLLYMSPEQLVAGPGALDGRADVYSVGATLFELLTLKPPLQGRDTRETLALILEKRPPRLRSLSPGLPRDLENIVSRTLEKKPEDRYDTMALLRDDLRAFAGAEAVQAKPVGWLSRMRQLVSRGTQ